MNLPTGQLGDQPAATADPGGARPPSGWSTVPSTLTRRIWTPRWLEKRPRAVRIAMRTTAIILLLLAAIWLVLFITKGRFLKGTFESIASSQLERQVAIGGDFQLYFAPFNVKFLAEDVRIANPAWAQAKQFFTARKVDTRLATISLILGRRVMTFADIDQAQVALEWDAQNRHNSWTFGDPDRPPEPLNLPTLERAALTKSPPT